jgi:hypothetical protein
MAKSCSLLQVHPSTTNPNVAGSDSFIFCSTISPRDATYFIRVGLLIGASATYLLPCERIFNKTECKVFHDDPFQPPKGSYGGFTNSFCDKVVHILPLALALTHLSFQCSWDFTCCFSIDQPPRAFTRVIWRSHSHQLCPATAIITYGDSTRLLLHNIMAYHSYVLNMLHLCQDDDDMHH